MYPSLKFGIKLVSWPTSGGGETSNMKEGVGDFSGDLCALILIAALEECEEEGQTRWDLCYYSNGQTSCPPIFLSQAPSAYFWCAHHSCVIAVLFRYYFSILINLVAWCQTGLAVK